MAYILDSIDRKIIDLLQTDGKLKIKEIAAELNLSNTPVFDRIKRLEREAYIKGYTAVIDKEKLGLQLMAFCSISLEKHKQSYLSQFVEDINSIPEVIECYHIAGLFDYLMKVVVKDMADYQNFITKKLASINNIGRVQSSFVMTEIKESLILPNEG